MSACVQNTLKKGVLVKTIKYFGYLLKRKMAYLITFPLRLFEIAPFINKRIFGFELTLQSHLYEFMALYVNFEIYL